MTTCVVLGMHRSGTSLVTRAVSLLGYSLGDPDALIPPAKDNPAGFWETSEIVSLNDEILAVLGGSWLAPPDLRNGWELGPELPPVDRARDIVERVFGNAENRIWKDPRASLLMPYWRRATRVDQTLVVLRHPIEVASSLGARSGIDDDWSHYLWLRHVTTAVSTSDEPVIVTDADVLARPTTWLRDVARQLDVAVTDAAAVAFEQHVDRSLRRPARPDGPRSDLCDLAVEVFELLRGGTHVGLEILPLIAAGNHDRIDHPGAAALAEVHDDLARARIATASMGSREARARLLRRRAARLEQRIARLQDDRGTNRARIDQLQVSAQHEREQSRRLARDLDRLRGRRSVRFALGLATMARPVFRLARRTRSGNATDEERPVTAGASTDERQAMTWIIKNPAPSGARGERWGDTHFARSLARHLTRLGHRVEVQPEDAWVDDAAGDEDAACDVVLLLRGKRPLPPTSNHAGALRVMWNISHPSDVSLEEYATHDLVFVASDSWARRLGEQVDVPVRALLQCTDLLDVPESSAPREGIVFVGNTRNVERPGVLWALEAGASVQIWGSGWTQTAARPHVVDRELPWEEVGPLYARSSATLNDHWEDMKQFGFINNRVFDALACGLPVISDWHEELAMLELPGVLLYRDRDELQRHLESVRTGHASLAEQARQGAEIVRRQFSFEQRATELVRHVEDALISRAATSRRG